jgi:hypothetical protein
MYIFSPGSFFFNIKFKNLFEITFYKKMKNRNNLKTKGNYTTTKTIFNKLKKKKKKRQKVP